jgi:hypothetical protein
VRRLAALIALLSLAASAQAETLDVLKQDALTALSRLESRHDRPEYWDSHAYWVHYLDLVLELKKETDLHVGQRLERARRALARTGVRVDVDPEGTVKIAPEPPSYADRAAALKDAAVASVFSRLAGQPK